MAQKARLTKRVRFAVGCTGVFVFLFSMPFLYGVFLGPFVSYLRSFGWTETSCLILESGIAMTDSGNSSGRRGQATYRPQFAYSYEVGGTTYRADRYWFFQMTFDSEERARREAAEHPVGSRATCYVNPNDPADAVFTREFRAFQLVGLVFPLGMFAMAIAAVVIAVRGPRALEGGMPSGLPIERGSGPGTGGVVLKPMTTPFGSLVASVMGAVVWNGFLLLMAYLPSRDLLDESASFTEFLRRLADVIAGSPDSWMGLFCVSPFVLIGVLLIFSIPHQILALFNPRPRLTLSPGTIPVGGSARLHWRLSNPGGRIRRLTIVLQAVNRTKRTPTPELKQSLVDLDRDADVQEGSVLVAIPEDAAPTSLRGPDFVVWSVRLVGEMFLWPDVEAEFSVTVVPATPRV